MSEKAESGSLHHLHSNRCLFMWGAYFCMGAYKRDVIKMSAFIHGHLFMVLAYFLWVPIIPINFAVCSFPPQPIMVD